MNRKCGAVPSRQASSDWGAREIALAVVLLLLCGFRLAAAENYEITVRRNVPVKMRDGVTLQADIYRPTANGKFPVLLVRTPYDKTQEMEFAVKAATRGYVVVAQDVRGRYASEGDWYPFKNESQDGYDTVEWAAALPYANGKVGMFGGSYVGATQYLAAIVHPPHLAGICPNALLDWSVCGLAKAGSLNAFNASPRSCTSAPFSFSRQRLLKERSTLFRASPRTLAKRKGHVR